MDFIKNFSALSASLSLLISLFFIWWLEPHSTGQIGFIILVITSVVVVLAGIGCLLKRLFSKETELEDNQALDG